MCDAARNATGQRQADRPDPGKVLGPTRRTTRSNAIHVGPATVDQAGIPVREVGALWTRQRDAKPPPGSITRGLRAQEDRGSAFFGRGPDLTGLVHMSASQASLRPPRRARPSGIQTIIHFLPPIRHPPASERPPAGLHNAFALDGLAKTGILTTPLRAVGARSDGVKPSRTGEGYSDVHPRSTHPRRKRLEPGSGFGIQAHQSGWSERNLRILA